MTFSQYGLKPGNAAFQDSQPASPKSIGVDAFHSLLDDLIDRILDDPFRAGGLELRNDRADETLFDDRVDVDPIRIGERRDGRFL